MFTDFTPLRRLLAFTTAISMVLPVFPAAAQDASQSAAPPARVGQIVAVDGGVSFNGAGSGGWAAATANYPISTGDSLYTQPGARAEIALDASTMTLAESTEIQVSGLTDTNLAATESQGEVFLNVASLPPGESFTITTPRGAVNIAANGQYDIAAGDENAPTIVAVFQGAASVTDPGATVQIAAGQAASLTGTDQTIATLGQANPDEFARRQLAVTITPPPAYVPQIADQMTGTYELGRYGDWDQSTQYGAVWYPRVDADWAPYREGHWADIQPWGWTWVDNEPWGFAPFHYGRWIDQGGRWGWTPAPAYQGGNEYQPVYAPAVVGFFGLALAAGITAEAFSRGDIGWVPLGPNEAYYPSYRASPDYIRRINGVNVRNFDAGNRNNNKGGFDPNHFANHRAATYIPADAMARGEQVGHYGHPVGPDMFRHARPIDPGIDTHAQNPNGDDIRLPPPGRPLAQMHPGMAPHPTEFVDRHNLPPAVVSHAPVGAPGQPPAPPHFATNPGYRPPPPPPVAGQHFGALPRPSGTNGGVRPFEAQGQPHFNQPEPPRPANVPQFHPNQPQGQPFHPYQPQAPRPPMPQVFQPQQPEPPRPAMQPFHPQQVQQPRPPTPAFQPPHMQAPAPPQHPAPPHPNKPDHPQ